MTLKICAEMSASHLGRLDRALAIVDAAADAGADMLKLQTWVKDTMVLRRGHMWKGKDLVDLYREAYLPWEFHQPIFDRCKERGIECFSAPFDKPSVDFLESLGCPRYKIASFELVDINLINYIARLGKPIILSTGMATESEISDAVRATGRDEPFDEPYDVTLLKCTSAYPASCDDANLMSMGYMRGRFQCDVGISDHTMGLAVPIAAVALRATYIEKHFTLSRADGGPDAYFSMEPHEFSQMVRECRNAEAALGHVNLGPVVGDARSVRRSLHWASDLPAGHTVTPSNFVTSRPADGLPPIDMYLISGRSLNESVKAGDPVRLSDTLK